MTHPSKLTQSPQRGFRLPLNTQALAMRRHDANIKNALSMEAGQQKLVNINGKKVVVQKNKQGIFQILFPRK